MAAEILERPALCRRAGVDGVTLVGSIIPADRNGYAEHRHRLSSVARQQSLHIQPLSKREHRPQQGTAFQALGPDENAQFNARSINEAAVDRWFLQKGLDYIRGHPWLSFGNGFRKIGAAFGLLPSPRRGFWPNLVHALSYGSVMTLGLWSMWAGRGYWREHLIYYALFVSFAAVTAVFFGHTSHRSYLDLYWIAFAAGALVRLRTKYFSTSSASAVS